MVKSLFLSCPLFFLGVLILKSEFRIFYYKLVTWHMSKDLIFPLSFYFTLLILLLPWNMFFSHGMLFYFLLLLWAVWFFSLVLLITCNQTTLSFNLVTLYCLPKDYVRKKLKTTIHIKNILRTIINKLLISCLCPYTTSIFCTSLKPPTASLSKLSHCSLVNKVLYVFCLSHVCFFSSGFKSGSPWRTLPLLQFFPMSCSVGLVSWY